MEFELRGPITEIETIAAENAIRELPRLRKHYGPGRWRKLKGIAKVGLPDGTICKAEVHWYGRTVSARKSSKSSGYWNKSMAHRHAEHQFVVCVHNEDHPASLELRKIYRVIPDASSAKHHLLRITDESGEDYLYPEDYFMAIDLPEPVERALLKTS